MLPTSAGGVALPACDSTRRALRLSECRVSFHNPRASSEKRGRGGSETNRRPVSFSIIVVLEFGSRDGEHFWQQP